MLGKAVHKSPVERFHSPSESSVGYHSTGRQLKRGECNEESIKDAIRKATSNVFRESLNGMENPYGSGDSSEKIVDRLKLLRLDGNIIKKRFYDIN